MHHHRELQEQGRLQGKTSTDHGEEMWNGLDVQAISGTDPLIELHLHDHVLQQQTAHLEGHELAAKVEKYK